MTEATPPQPLALRPRQAAEVLGVSQRTLWALTNSPDGPPVVRLGRVVIYPVDQLRAWLDRRAESGAGR